MTFDAIKALQEELAGLAAVEASIRRRESVAEESIAKSEQELNDIRKVRGYLRIETDRKRDVLRQLQQAKEKTPS